MDKTNEELQVIKKEKQKELYEARQEKQNLVENIMSLQGMVKLEKSYSGEVTE